jgi:hypothetical protein
MAHVQYLLWKSHLVSDAVRSFDAYYLVDIGLLIFAFGRSHQYPIDEDTRPGSQRTYLSFTHDLLPISSCVDICE